MSATPGLVVSATDPIRSFLSSAAASPDLAADLRDLASALSSEPAVPYRSIRAIWCADSSHGRPPLRQLLQGAQFVLSSPKPREKSDELKARLEKFREMQERREYAELVKDVAPKKDETEPFSSYKDQLGFGLHVVVIMFTGYLVGFAAFRALFSNSPVMDFSECCWRHLRSGGWYADGNSSFHHQIIQQRVVIFGSKIQETSVETCAL